MKECDRCHHKVPSKDRFCVYCGNKITIPEYQLLKILIIILVFGLLIGGANNNFWNIGEKQENNESSFTETSAIKSLVGTTSTSVKIQKIASTPTKVICPHAPDTRVKEGDQIIVARLMDNLRIRSEPTINSEKIGSLTTGAKLIILGGPSCADNYLWWLIKTENGLIGWVAEGSRENYYLEPVSKNAP